MPSIANKITCPYCGAEMLLDSNDEDLEDDWKWWYTCLKCEARTPVAETPNAARDKAWLNPGRSCEAAKLIYCKDCAHLCYEDLGIYYCGLHRIAGQLNPDDYCSRATKRNEAKNEDNS